MVYEGWRETIDCSAVGVAMASSLGIVNPKKRREIDGVSGSSMVDLKATLFQAEEHAKHARTAGVAAPRSKLVVKAVQNKGVEERNRRDQEAEHRRNNPGASLADKSGQVCRTFLLPAALPAAEKAACPRGAD